MIHQKLSLNDFEAVGVEELLNIKGGAPHPALIFGYGRGPGNGNHDDGPGGGSPQDMLLACAQNDDCCQSTVTNRIYELGNTMITTSTNVFGEPETSEYLVSDDYLITVGNEAYAVCMGYSVPGW